MTRNRRVRRQPGDGDGRTPRGHVSAQQHRQCQRNQAAADRPGFVAGHARGHEREPRRRRPARRAAIEPLRGQRDRQQGRAEEQRFGHRRALEIEHVRVGEEQRGAGESAGDRSGASDDERRECPGADGHRRDGDRDRRRARPVPRVHLDGNHVQDVGEGKPDGADLLPARHEAVEDAAGDHEVGPRVVVRERETRGRVVDRRRASGDERREGNESRRPCDSHRVRYRRVPLPDRNRASAAS